MSLVVTTYPGCSDALYGSLNMQGQLINLPRNGLRRCQDCHYAASFLKLRIYDGESHPVKRGRDSVHPGGSGYVTRGLDLDSGQVISGAFGSCVEKLSSLDSISGATSWGSIACVAVVAS